jgi:hypothetical protein
VFFEPLRAWRHVDITDRRTGNDWVYAMKDLVDVFFPDAERIRIENAESLAYQPSFSFSALS